MFHDSTSLSIYFHWSTKWFAETQTILSACRANFHHVFDWFPTILLVKCSPGFLCLCDISLKLGIRPLSLEHTSLLSKVRVLILSFCWCRLVHIHDSCLLWKLCSCWVELCFIQLLSHDKFQNRIVSQKFCPLEFWKMWFVSNCHVLKFQLVQGFWNWKVSGKFQNF